MSAKKGNIYWTLRQNHGRTKQYTPEEVEEKAIEFFQYCLDNPLKEQQVFHSQGVITKTTVEKLRPFTIHGLCAYMDITPKTLENYSKLDPAKDPRAEDYLRVIERVKNICYTQKFEGAAVGFFNANIIARDLGLQDKKIIEDNTDTVIKVEIIE